MSGSTIGGVVGGVIGFFVGGPTGAMWGWQIGSLVGAVVDPDQIVGPRLDEARVQTAQDGVPLIYGYGTFTCAGNLAWVDQVHEHENTESAKGGPEQVTYTYTVSYMIVVCKGPISGYKIIKRNGKIVYDARTDAELSEMGYSANDISETRAAQAAFLQRATLYYGTEDQMPDPTMVAVLGADEVPAYSGIAYIVLKDDETREGEVSQYEFVVSTCGERHEDFNFTEILVTGYAKSVGGPVFARALVADELTFQGIPQSSGADIAGMTAAYGAGRWMAVHDTGVRYATFGSDEWLSGSLDMYPAGAAKFGQLISGGTGWLAVVPNGSHPPTAFVAQPDSAYFVRTAVDGVNSAGTPTTGFRSAPYLIRANGWYILSGVRYFAKADEPGGPYVSVWDGLDEQAAGRNPNGACIMGWYDLAEHGNEWYAVIEWHFDDALKRFQIIRSENGIEDWSDFEVIVDVPRGTPNEPAQLCICGGHLVCYNTDGTLWTTANGWTAPITTGLVGPGNGGPGVVIKGGRRIVAADDLCYCIGADDDLVVFDPATLAVSDPITLPIQNLVSIAVSNLEGSALTPIPDSPGFYINQRTGEIVGPPGTTIDVCQPTLGEIVASQCERRGVEFRDVSELTDLVGGYRIAKPSSPQANIQGLQPGYFFGASEFDGILHFPKRGRDLTFELTHDDFVERDGDSIQWERTQERDMLRKVTVAYVDPGTTYTPTTQQAERRSQTIAAEGESTIELPVTGSKDWAAQVADKSIKVAWGEPDECTFHVSIDHAELVTGAEGTVPYTDGQPTVIRIERIEDEGLVRMVTGRITRRDLYESNASGAAKPLPRFPGSNMRGPTDGVLMNIPVLLDQDDRPGIHWAASRMLSGWQGTQLQIRRAGQWVNVGQTVYSAGMGALLSPLPAHSGDLDTVNTMHVRFNVDLESVTYVNLLQERNPLAILREDGTAEIVQFQTAAEIAPGEYELTTLLRGRLATTPDDHETGARVVFLDERVQYATLEPTDIGATLEYRFVSLGTDPDAAPIQTLDLTTMESQMEWPVDWLQVHQDGDDFTLTWLARDRLGNDVFPVRSANWRGYQVSYSHSGGSGSVTVQTETHTFTLPGASNITFSVAQLNQYTGAGPAQSVTIP